GPWSRRKPTGNGARKNLGSGPTGRRHPVPFVPGGKSFAPTPARSRNHLYGFRFPYPGRPVLLAGLGRFPASGREPALAGKPHARFPGRHGRVRGVSGRPCPPGGRLGSSFVLAFGGRRSGPFRRRPTGGSNRGNPVRLPLPAPAPGRSRQRRIGVPVGPHAVSGDGPYRGLDLRSCRGFRKGPSRRNGPSARRGFR